MSDTYQKLFITLHFKNATYTKLFRIPPINIFKINKYFFRGANLRLADIAQPDDYCTTTSCAEAVRYRGQFIISCRYPLYACTVFRRGIIRSIPVKFSPYVYLLNGLMNIYKF